MLLLILLLPLYNFLIVMFCSSILGSNGVIFISLFNLLIGLFYVLNSFYLIVKTSGFFVYASKFTWINVGYFNLEWNFFIDSITVSMLFVIYIISILVHIYSISYMKYDPHFNRFFSLLSLFTFFMLLLVMSYNLVELFLGWEGVGLCSYLLINFWFTRVQANKAAIKAMLVNRIGDSFLLLAIVLIYYIFKSLDFLVIFSMIEVYNFVFLKIFDFNIHVYSLISFFLVCAAIGKSAQLGLHTWLPDAMEGPTPVSALIHAATMVTAGVFLLIRLNCFFEYSFDYISIFVISVGAITAVFGSIVAVVQNDIKKIIAYSTCSQLGYMFVACGFFRYDVALFHLFNHAFFKALLFLSAGMLIYMFSDEQDIRRMGGLNQLLSFIYVCFLIGSYSLMGLPFFSGYYSKELILEICFSTFTTFSFFIYILLVMAAFFTALYSIRLIHLVFFDSPKGFYVYYKNIKEYDNLMTAVLFILSIFSILSGFLFKDLMVGFGSDFLNFIHNFRVFESFNDKILNYNEVFFDYEFLNSYYKNIPLFINFLAIFLYFLYVKFIKRGKDLEFKSNLLRVLSYIGNVFYKFLVNKWYFDYLYNYFFTRFTLRFSYEVLYKDLDKNLLEIFGPFFFYNCLKKISSFLESIFFGSLFQYFFLFLFGLFLFFIFSLSDGDYIDFFLYFFNYLLFLVSVYYYNK